MSLHDLTMRNRITLAARTREARRVEALPTRRQAPDYFTYTLHKERRARARRIAAS